VVGDQTDRDFLSSVVADEEATASSFNLRAVDDDPWASEEATEPDGEAASLKIWAFERKVHPTIVGLAAGLMPSTRPPLHRPGKRGIVCQSYTRAPLAPPSK